MNRKFGASQGSLPTLLHSQFTPIIFPFLLCIVQVLMCRTTALCRAGHAETLGCPAPALEVDLSLLLIWKPCAAIALTGSLPALHAQCVYGGMPKAILGF